MLLIRNDISRDTDYEINLFIMEHIERHGNIQTHRHLFCQLRGQPYAGVLYARLGEELGRSASSIYLIALIHKLTSRIEQHGLMLGVTSRNEYVMFWNALSYGEHRLEQCAVGILAKATHLTRRSHIHT